MESLQTLVRNLAIILLLASFLEMLLPSKSMKGFIKLVMGLFVISAILTPITSFLGMTMETVVPAWTRTVDQEFPVLASGEEGEKIGTNAVNEQYKTIVINQVKAIVAGVKGVKDLQVKVELVGGAGGLTDIPQINGIYIRLVPDGQGVKPIEEVVVDLSSTTEKQPVLSDLAQEVREKVATFMQLPLERVIVTEG